LSAFNTSNLSLFTTDTPGTGFPSQGFQFYFDPTDVATDFGSSSLTYQMALAVFSQTPNILTGNGYLVIIPYLSSETLAASITRTVSQVQYFGVMSSTIETQADMLAAAAVIQANPLLVGFFAQYNPATIAPGGALDLLRSGTLTHSRGLYYGDSSGSPAGINALLEQAAYAGRALSTNFSGAKTTQNMQLKTLATIQPDPTMSALYYAQAQAAGADIYASIQGLSGVLTSGANSFFDNVYNLGWYVGATQVAGFNFLQGISTKLPQTEDGMDGLKGAYTTVAIQSGVNGYTAPGVWTSTIPFGNPATFLANIANNGYYIYSQPIAQQLASARAARQAPLVQIALKLAGAINTSNVIINVNP
jgi:hypothetical protein